MKPDIKAQWLTALRGGDYQQGWNYLHQGDQYCCLGVLCDLYANAVGPEWEKARDDVHSMHGTEGVLPFKVRKWAGIEDCDPLDLTIRNDQGSTFEELANLIERDL